MSKLKFPVLMILNLFLLQYTSIAQSKGQLQWALGAVPEAYLTNHDATYHMFDTEGKKVGSMESKLINKEDQIIFKDISQFDDGSVYEEASFTYSKKPLTTTEIKIKFKTANASLDIDVAMEDKYAKGTYVLNDKTHPIDSIYDYDVIRPELYTFLSALAFEVGMKKTVKVLAPMSFRVVEAEISVLSEEKITTASGEFETFKIFLDGKGVIPTNYIYVDKASHQVVKYEVTGQMKLDIVLMKNQ